MTRPTFERLENREVFANSLGLSLPEILPVVDSLPMETAPLKLAPKAVAAGDVNTDGADFVQAFILPYIEQDNLYKQASSASGNREFMSQLSQDLLGHASDTPHDTALNQLGLASDGRFDDWNRPQGIIAILIG